MNYTEFLASKRLEDSPSGLDIDPDELPFALFDFQREITTWALRRGRAAILASTGLGKAQPDDELVLTPDGWARMDELITGSQVIGSHGRPTTVLGVYPQGEREIAQVTFNDGATVRCDLDHLWTVSTDSDVSRGVPWRTISLREIISLGLTETTRLRWRIPVMRPLDLPARELPIDPYVLGVLLGDGYLSEQQITFTTIDEEIVERISMCVSAPVRVVPLGKSDRAPTYRLSTPRAGTRHPNPLMVGLRDLDLLGKLSHEKGIPSEYQFASIEQRVELLRGLMDTDGYISVDGCIQFCSSSPRLAEDVLELVRGLGGIARRNTKIPTYMHRGERRVGRLHYTLTMRLPASLVPFRLSRKISRMPVVQKYGPVRKIASVEMDGTALARCICVGASDQLYVTSGHAVTHNTAMQLAFADRVAREHNAPVLIFAPLAVSSQTVREGDKFGIAVTLAKNGNDISEGVNVTNYERMDKFDATEFVGVVLDESSILKSFDGPTRRDLTIFGQSIPFRLCCSATPAPNDWVELGSQSEFLGVMSQKEMMALYFTQDGNSTQKWRLKGHAHNAYWQWVASWAVACRKPSDLGYSDDGYILPPLRMIPTVYEVDPLDAGLSLFAVEAVTLDERRRARQVTVQERCQLVADIVAQEPDEQWLIWCGLNTESDLLSSIIPGAVEVRGSTPPDEKEWALTSFADGSVKIMVSKPSIAGFGMNFQSCARMVFCGLSDSFEQLFQAIRRCWRFGQTREVHCHVVTASLEGAVVRNIERKERQWENMMDETVQRVAPQALGRQGRVTQDEERETREGSGWTLMLGDCVERLADVDDESVGLTVFSPPFPGMYVYTNSAHDMGNVRSTEEMLDQYKFLIPELLRVTMPGRSCCVHLTQGTAQKGRDGYIGIRDFRGKVIEGMEDGGWIYYGEVCIDKDPQVKAIRTKDRGLLFKTLANDSAHLHMALADYLLQFRKHGDNPAPIKAGISERYKNSEGWITADEWIEWAAPVWYRQTGDYPGGIRETDVLNVRAAREEADERHLAPLQLGVIERAVKLWSNPGDLVLSPFAGIGSEGFVSLQQGRQFVGVELKRSYFEQACRNLAIAAPQVSLFDDAASE